MKFYRMSLSECHAANGLVVVIDVLRAFTTAAMAFARGAEEIVLVSTVEEAFKLRSRYPDYLLIGEVDGLPIEGFDLPNSPSTIYNLNLSSKRLVQRTTAGTQGVVRATGAGKLLAASLCVAAATCEYIKRLNPSSITFIETGVRDAVTGEEDVACADYIAGLLDSRPPPLDTIERRVRNSRAAQKFVGDYNSVFPRADLEQALRVDCFDFAMEAQPQHGQLVLRAVRHTAMSELAK